MLTAAGILCVSSAFGARAVHRFAVENPRFTLLPQRTGAFTIEGLRYTSRAKIVRVFAEDLGRSVFLMPLAERRRRLLAVDWVEEASVSRLWPDRVVVRIRERRPVAFVMLRSGVVLIDRDGVLLQLPPQAPFSFPVLHGVRDDENESRRAVRVRAMMRVLEELGPHSNDVSEIHAGDLGNLRVITNLDGSAVELALGEADFGRRYRNFLEHYQEIRKRSPELKQFDLRLDGRIVAKD
jgi:cell division protein FtsQ